MVYDNERVVYSKTVEAQNYLDAFKNIQLICKENGIDLIFVFPPNFQVFNSSFYDRFNKLVNRENKIFVYDTLNTVYKDKNYFYDGSHLTKGGAEIFTSELSVFINATK
ncbi:hypothetical protein JCM19274_384 [Algibacter lectus]|uniref:Uncharacterized protein n=1 Tax=Algibacter lectus TaxID=221126 RepID=A0A090WXG9_9FLAO|nr:hypothetical protein JCM19274_384 [Algibacter lectus]